MLWGLEMEVLGFAVTGMMLWYGGLVIGHAHFSGISIVPALAFLCAAHAQESEPVESKPFVECNRDELAQAVPELAGMQFDANQERLEGLLAAAGGDLAGMFAKLADLGATEQVHEMRFADGMEEASRQETFRYVLKILPEGSPEPFDESRAPAPVASAGFPVVSHFEGLLRSLLPQYREEMRFRFLGRAQDSGRDSWLIAFEQRAGSPALPSHIGWGNGAGKRVQGLVWIDGATQRLVRLRLDVSGPVEGSPLENLTIDVAFVPMKFQSTGELWLPARVTVHGRDAAGEMHSVRRYSDYRLNGSGYQGIPTVTVTIAEDPWEMLDRSISLERENQPAGAIALEREALRLNPAMTIGRYHLAATLSETGDFAGAEAELREAVKRAPNFGPAHNLLGILLFKRGDLSGAVAELRASARLQPQDANVHFNLARALEKVDRKAALEEYRTASTLAPDDAAIKSRHEQFEGGVTPPPAPPASGATIKVEVRQVLVPVVVTDQGRHHVTGLKQADFHVFEDGVEQKISGFSVEDAGASSAATVAAGAREVEQPGNSTAPATTAPAKPVAIRRTFVICIDTLHTALASLVHVREALANLFRSEPAGDAQYVVIGIGTGTQVIAGPTTSPAAVLKAIESKDFEKLFAGQAGESPAADLKAFQRSLEEARAACESGSDFCVPLMRALPPQANLIAGRERIATVAFLQQLRNLVESLARGTERRTMVFVSDGFQLVPGKQAFELMAEYFGNSQGSSLSTDRMTELEPILRQAANHNIPIYTVDSRGLYTQRVFDASTHGPTHSTAPTAVGATDYAAIEASDTLREIAAATGGTAFQNRNDLRAGMEQAFADGRQYYLLAYVPGNSNPDGKFRAISVRVRDAKLAVNAKPGYWATDSPGGN